MAEKKSERKTMNFVNFALQYNLFYFEPVLSTRFDTFQMFVDLILLHVNVC